MINVKNLAFTYPGNKEATLRGISFQIGKGEIYGFLGPSGAGKSTTQKILIRLLSNYSGEVDIMNKSLVNWTNIYYNYIGVGFELPNHYSKLTGFENLKLFSSFYEKRSNNIMEWFERVGLQDAANQKTQDYSKGMKMRLNFIRALIHNPEILFFDEPTSGLDPVNARKIKDIILELKAKGKTIFLTTHNMHDAEELCDRVAFITNGEIKQEDAPQALKIRFGQPLLKLEYEDKGLQTREFKLNEIGQNKDFLDILNSKSIVSMHTKEASLDEVFIKTTGTELTQTD